LIEDRSHPLRTRGAGSSPFDSSRLGPSGCSRGSLHNTEGPPVSGSRDALSRGFRPILGGAFVASPRPTARTRARSCTRCILAKGSWLPQADRPLSGPITKVSQDWPVPASDRLIGRRMNVEGHRRSGRPGTAHPRFDTGDRPHSKRVPGFVFPTLRDPEVEFTADLGSTRPHQASRPGPSTEPGYGARADWRLLVPGLQYVVVRVGAERLRYVARNLPHQIGRISVESVRPEREAQGFLRAPDLLVAVRWEELGRIAHGHPPDRHSGSGGQSVRSYTVAWAALHMRGPSALGGRRGPPSRRTPLARA
jgi:hypothetical protein